MDGLEYDKVTQASLNGIYVKAQEMGRGHNEVPAPSFSPPGAAGDAETHASTHASDAQPVGAFAEPVAPDAESHASDAQPTATCADSGASDAESHASDAGSHASDVESHASTHASDGE